MKISKYDNLTALEFGELPDAGGTSVSVFTTDTVNVMLGHRGGIPCAQLEVYLSHSLRVQVYGGEEFFNNVKMLEKHADCYRQLALEEISRLTTPADLSEVLKLLAEHMYRVGYEDGGKDFQ